ncbi:MAG: DNA-directed RNA polymerase subunit beta' [Cytophagales bacterium]|jgi:DNA-directed RNA polymerase subunit beta'|nr:DNA-directed RNA polymerase subunit beta' [Cytophagales bacterium]
MDTRNNNKNTYNAKNTYNVSDFSEVCISLASSDYILKNSFGEVTQSETINYKTFRPEPNGLFCERIFGPTKNWECFCGKYKHIRYRDVICDRCGVEVTSKNVRRERFGHICLTVPVVHPWFFKLIPSRIGSLLGIPLNKLAKIIYYEYYIVIQPGIKGKEGLAEKEIFDEQTYDQIMNTVPMENEELLDSDPDKVIILTGAEAVENLLKNLDLKKMKEDLMTQSEYSNSVDSNLGTRIGIVKSFLDSQTRCNNKPEWTVLHVLPVIPPDLRPIVVINGGKFATSDLNDLYRRVIIRNNRLKRLISIKAPRIILNNEKRMLQEAVEKLIDNTQSSNKNDSIENRALKSLTDIIKGKQGRLRQNLLGKRVDYSGRSVITVNPQLKLHECGLSKDMALELFTPFVLRRLIERGIATTIKTAKNLIQGKDPIVFEILKNIIVGHPVLLNRAPTLHKLNIRAFQPKLIDFESIQLHPLVCSGFNADFDGDQMGVFIPLSLNAITEASILMLSAHNILSDANGEPTMYPRHDIVLGLYYLTKEKHSTAKHKILGEGLFFANVEEVQSAINNKKLDIQAKIKLLVKNIETGKKKIIDTTAGRALFNQFLPKSFNYVNELLTNNKIRKLIVDLCNKVYFKTVVKFLDDIKELGFYYSYKSGMSFSLDDVIIPVSKNQLIRNAREEANEILDNYMLGFITEHEKYNQTIDVWVRTSLEITTLLLETLKKDNEGFNPVYMMIDSSARGSKDQVRQLCGLKGLIFKPKGSSSDSGNVIIETPIVSNFKEGLTPIEYFISAHGSRKGLADTALKTANAGYLTRRLVDVSCDTVICEDDCHTPLGISFRKSDCVDKFNVSFPELILGRICSEEVIDYRTGSVIVKVGKEVNEEIIASIEKLGISEVKVRSPLTCKSRNGVCSKCYGRDLSTRKLAEVGKAVGVIAAQSIGEPGLQLTLNTFHGGGVATGSSIVSKIIAGFYGIVKFENTDFLEKENASGKKVKIILNSFGSIKILHEKTNLEYIRYNIPYGASVYVNEGACVEASCVLCDWDPYNAVIMSPIDGVVGFSKIEDGITSKVEINPLTGVNERVIVEQRLNSVICNVIVADKKNNKKALYNAPPKSHLFVEDGDFVKRGQILLKIPRNIKVAEDIVGGLPRIVDLFEVRSSVNPAVLNEIDGFVTIGEVFKTARKISITSPVDENLTVQYMIPLNKNIWVQNGDFVKHGDSICSGDIVLPNILKSRGAIELGKYLAYELQKVYRLQGISISNKHFEIIIKQMLKYVEIEKVGDTEFILKQFALLEDFTDANKFLTNKIVIIDSGESTKFKVGDIISKETLEYENLLLDILGKKIIQGRDTELAVGKLVIRGITNVAINTKSFLSAASFQETSSVLTDAAINGSIDNLVGIKENIIAGKLIPVGTGFRKFRNISVYNKKELEEMNQ